MKTFIGTIILLLLSINSFGQMDRKKEYREFSDFPLDIINVLDQMGNDKSPFLTKDESSYFNFFFHDSNPNFDFSNKKIGFMMSRRISNKKEYFEGERERFSSQSRTANASLVLFNEEQKVESGGYDAFIVYWSKFSISAEDVIKIVNKK